MFIFWLICRCSLFPFKFLQFYVDRIESNSKQNILIKTKKIVRMHHALTILMEWLFIAYIYCYDRTLNSLRTNEMEEVYEMAIRAVDNQRVETYIFEEERRRVDANGTLIKKEDDSYELISLPEARKLASQQSLTVVKMRGKTARQHAEERDRMLEVYSKKGEVIQRVHTGTMDFNSLINGVIGVERMLPPEGHCENCGVNHVTEGHCDSDGYLSWDKLMEFAEKKKGKKGIYKREIILDHFDDTQRTELANFSRDLGGDGLGEG